MITCMLLHMYYHLVSRVMACFTLCGNKCMHQYTRHMYVKLQSKFEILKANIEEDDLNGNSKRCSTRLDYIKTISLDLCTLIQGSRVDCLRRCLQSRPIFILYFQVYVLTFRFSLWLIPCVYLARESARRPISHNCIYEISPT